MKCVCGKHELVKTPKRLGSWRRHIMFTGRGLGVQHTHLGCWQFKNEPSKRLTYAPGKWPINYNYGSNQLRRLH